MSISAKDVNELRKATGAGMMDCKKALAESGGDIDGALDYLRKKGQKVAAKRADRDANEGVVIALQEDGKALLLALSCETDFVARTDDFETLAHNLTLHIAFAAPRYLTRQDILEEVTQAERVAYRAQALEEGKPERIVDRIIEGRLEKFYQQVCLMEQSFVKDEDKTVQDLITDAIAKLGENVVLRRFVRYELGGGWNRQVFLACL